MFGGDDATSSRPQAVPGGAVPALGGRPQLPTPAGLVELLGWPGPWPITPVVVDTGVLLNSVFRGFRWSRDELMLDAARGGFIRLFAPDTVALEMQRHLSARSAWSERRRLDDVAPYRERWEACYLPVLRFVSVEASGVEDPRVAAVAARDPSDAGFAALASLLAPCIALAEDADITDNALATREWEALAVLAGSTTHSAGPIVTAMFGGNVGVQLIVSAIRGIARTPWWPLVLAVVAGGVLLIHQRDPITRERIGRWFDAALKAVEPLIDYLEFAAAAGEDTQARLRAAAILPVSEPAPPFHRLVRVTAVTPRPSTATELTALLARDGLNVQRDRVLRVLRTSGTFVSVASNRWQVGRSLHPQ